MKKVMFVAASIAVGLAMADGITSANIVGYHNSALRGGNTMTGPDFIPCGGGQIDLTDITVGGSAYTPGEFSDVVYVQVLNSLGGVDGNYTWADLTGDFDAGWYDYDTDMTPISKGEVLFTLGDGLWVAGGDDIHLAYNGQVMTGTQVVIPLRGGNKAVANPYPTGFDLTDISVGGTAYTPGEFSDVVYVQILNSLGGVDGNYTWADLTGDFDAGWYDYDTDMTPISKGDVILTAGQGLWVAGGDDIDLQVKALSL